MKMKIISHEIKVNEETFIPEIIMTIAFPMERIDSRMTNEEFVDAFREAVEEYNGRNHEQR